MCHMNLPLEILRDTIIVNRPYNDPTEFQIVAVVDSSECGLESAKDNAKFIVEACNNYQGDNHPGKTLDPSIGSSPPEHEIPPDKIMVDRAQYERMTNFVSGIFGALPIPPHTFSKTINLTENVQKLCSDYARGE